MLFLGIDGGGTKTEFALYDDKGKLLGTARLGCANVWQYDEHSVTEVLKEGLELVLEGSEFTSKDISSVGFGAACFGESDVKDKDYHRICQKVFKDTKVKIISDVEVAMIASLGDQPGINIVCGTGSMAFAMDETFTVERCGGWGHQIGDEGSGHWLGRKALEIFTKQSDGRLEKTILYDLIKKELSLQSDFEIIELVDNILYRGRTEMAAIQKVLFEAAKQKDKYALTTYEEAAKEMAMLAVALRNKLDFQKTVKVSYSGGVFQVGDILMKPFKKTLKDLGFQVIDPKYSPVHGAVILAAKQFDKHVELMSAMESLL